MKSRQIINLIFAILLLSWSTPAVASDNSKTYQDTRKMLSVMSNPYLDSDKLAVLFRVGDERITDLTQALRDPNPEISRRAQVVIRYLGDDVGMKALYAWYDQQEQIVIAGPIPLPLRERDYKFIYANYINNPVGTWNEAEQYVYALALDDSPRAKAVLNEIIKSAGNLDEPSSVNRAIKLVRASQPEKILMGQKDLARLVLNNAFFIAPIDRKYASAKLLGLNGAKDKALIEIYINRGRLAEEWYHIVIRKCDEGWKFFSITPVAVS